MAGKITSISVSQMYLVLEPDPKCGPSVPLKGSESHCVFLAKYAIVELCERIAFRAAFLFYQPVYEHKPGILQVNGVKDVTFRSPQ